MLTQEQTDNAVAAAIEHVRTSSEELSVAARDVFFDVMPDHMRTCNKSETHTLFATVYCSLFDVTQLEALEWAVDFLANVQRTKRKPSSHESGLTTGKQ